MTHHGGARPMSYFSLFDLEPSYALPSDELDHAYRRLASRVHPDRVAGGTIAERQEAINLTSIANEAYRTLKTPVLRARHLLDLRGVVIGDSGAPLPSAFLDAQIEWREALQEARAAGDGPALCALGATVREHLGTLGARLAADLDRNGNDAGAVECVLQLMFLDKLVADIDDARDELEAGCRS